MRTQILSLVLACVVVGQAQESEEKTVDSGIPKRITDANEIEFKYSSFTFARIKYSGPPGGRRSSRGLARSRWATDYPDADLNFSLHFQNETGLKTTPDSIVVELTDPNLLKLPFIYLVEGGSLHLTSEEIGSLRKYLLGGGFLMLDDFWGEQEWKSVAAQFRQVFPNRKPIELSLDHPIFRSFYEIREKPQVPNIGVALRGRSTGVTWERADANEVHYRGLFDDEGRLMVIFCHNTDLADGWERLTKNEYYYREFSLKRAFPMGINIVVYALSQ